MDSDKDDESGRLNFISMMTTKRISPSKHFIRSTDT
jgi:hypothetical protein